MLIERLVCGIGPGVSSLFGYLFERNDSTLGVYKGFEEKVKG